VSTLGGVIFSLAILAIPSPAFAAASWSQPVVISPSLPSGTPNAFAFDPAGNELWVDGPGITNGVQVQAAQRSFGGTWSPATTVWKISSVGVSSVQSLTASLSASGNAAAAWLFGSGVEIALRSPAGAWHAPVVFASNGGAANLVSKLDAQGHGVAAWSQMTATASVVEAVTWTAAGVFSSVTQLSAPSQGEFTPDLAVDEAGAAVVVWEAAAPQNPSGLAQVESSTRPAGGNWSAAAVASAAMPIVSGPRVALDGAGNATVVWQQGTTLASESVYAATQPAGGTWGSSTRIEPASALSVAQSSVATDSAGNVTAVWEVDIANLFYVHTATRPAGGAWGTPASLGQCASNGGSGCLIPPVVAARDGSIAVVGFTAAGGLDVSNVGVRLGSGQWTSLVIPGNPKIAYVAATNGAIASAVFPVRNGLKYHNAWDQSDYR
jgi:hypothetical protein